jgi:hypothetical protein
VLKMLTRIIPHRHLLLLTMTGLRWALGCGTIVLG